MKKRFGALPAISAVILSAAMLLTGCGSSSSKTASLAYDGDAAGAAYEPYDSNEMALDGYDGDSARSSDGSGTDSMLLSGRKVIYRANLQLETKQYDETIAALLQKIGEAGGYVEQSDCGGSAEYGSRWANYTFRVPVDHYESFLSAAGEAGSVVSKSESSQDVTGEYTDVEARLSTLEAQRTRLQQLSEQADNLQDLLAIEEQLSEVQYRIESYTGQKKELDDQIDSTTVTVSVSEVRVYTPTSRSFLERFGESFRDGIESFVECMQELAIWAAGHILWILLFIVLFMLVRLFRKRRPSGRHFRLPGRKKKAPAQDPSQNAENHAEQTAEQNSKTE